MQKNDPKKSPVWYDINSIRDKNKQLGKLLAYFEIGKHDKVSISY
jgi:hypothetical protein